MSKSIEQRYKKLTDVEHVLLRPGMYVGNINPNNEISFIYNTQTGKMEKRSLTYSPAFLKMFDEIISNSVDESKRKGSKLDEIRVEIGDDGWISVWDNGGIPVEINKDHDQYVPEMIFSELKAGSNFDDEEQQTLTGQNGVGASLVNIFSKEFIVETCDGKNKFKQIFQNNLTSRSIPKVSPSEKSFTKISYYPDYERLQTKLDEDTKLKLVKRVVDIAGTNPNLKVKLNGETIKLKDFEDYVKLYTEEFIYEENDNWKVAVGRATDGFENVSFVNSTHTKDGAHIDYVMNQIVSEVRDYIEKKHKIEIKPSNVKSHFFLYLDCKIVNPRYASQTKEYLITDPKDFKTEYKVTDKFIKKIIKSKIIEDILIWIAGEEEKQRQRELKKMSKEVDKKNLKKIIKLSDATSENRSECMLFLVEGDSAAGNPKDVRNPKTMAVFPLRGKPINVRGASVSDLKENEEFKNLMSIIGLQIGEKVESVSQIRYGKIVILTDNDLDGFSITGQLINMFYTFWPELFQLGIMYRFVTPYVKVFLKDETLCFFTDKDFKKWCSDNKDLKYTIKHYKGLGTSTPEDFEIYFKNMEKNHLIKLVPDKNCSETVDLAFNKKRADDRKDWLSIR
jgi:DNA topoisomerase-2